MSTKLFDVLADGEFKIDAQDFYKVNRSRTAAMERGKQIKLQVVTEDLNHGSPEWYFAVQHFLPTLVRATGSMLERENRHTFWSRHLQNFGQGYREVESVSMRLHEDAAQVLFYSHILFGAELTQQSAWMEHVYTIDFNDSFCKFPLNVLGTILEYVLLRETDGLLDCSMEMILYVINNPIIDFDRLEREIASV